MPRPAGRLTLNRPRSAAGAVAAYRIVSHGCGSQVNRGRRATGPSPPCARRAVTVALRQGLRHALPPVVAPRRPGRGPRWRGPVHVQAGSQVFPWGDGGRGPV